MDFRFDEGHNPHHINADLHDDVGVGDDNLEFWIAAGVIVFLLLSLVFGGLVTWFLTRA